MTVGSNIEESRNIEYRLAAAVPNMANNLKVTLVGAEGVRMVEDGRAPDVVVNIRLLSKKNST